MDIDTQISALARMPNPDLGAIDGVTLAARAAAEQRQSRMMMSVVTVLALFVGLAGSMVPAAPASASTMLLGPPPELMPLAQMAQE